jgi:hypothetical protein
MTNDNLPPGTTAADIDRHFGAPDKVRIIGTVTFGVEAEVPVGALDSEKRDALKEAVGDGSAEIVHVEVEDEQLK